MAMSRLLWLVALATFVAAVQNITDSRESTQFSTVVVHLSLVSNATTRMPSSRTASSQSSITTSVNPSWGSLGTAASSNPNATNTTMDPGASCNAAFVSWTSEFEYTTTVNSTKLYSSLTYWTEFPKGNDSFTLCDGWPRAHGEPSTYSSSTTSTSSGPIAITRTSDHTTPKPSCTIGKSACSSLWSSYNKNLYSDSSAPEPACELPSSACDPLTTFWTASNHPPCLFDADPVRLVYFPVSVKGDRLCGTNYTTVASNESMPQTAEALGTTFTSGTAYISFANLRAYDRCGEPVGTDMSNFFLPLPSSEVSSRCGEYGFNQFGPTSVPLNFADLNTPIALSVYSCMVRCQFGVHDHWQPLCPTIYDDYAPALAYPTDHIRKLQPEWAKCGFEEQQLRSDILYDPPLALSEATTEAPVTLPPQTAHISTALPPATPTPTPTPVVTTSPDNSDPGNNDPGDDDDNDTNEEGIGSGENDPPAEEDNGTSDDNTPQDPNDSDASALDPAINAPNVAGTSAAAIGDIIASVIGLNIPVDPSNSAQTNDDGPLSDAPPTTDDQDVSTDDNGEPQVGSIVVAPGSAITTSGIVVSAVAGGSAVVVNGATMDSNEATAAISSALADGGSIKNSPDPQGVDSSDSQSSHRLENLMATIASAAAGNGDPGSEKSVDESFVTVAGQTLPIETNAAGAVLLGGHTLPTDGAAVTIGGRVYSMSDDVVYQGNAAVATINAAAAQESPVTLDVALSTNAAGSLVLDGTILSDGGAPVTVNGQTFSLSAGTLYQNAQAVATMASSEKGSTLTIDGETLEVSTNAQGELVLDGKTISPGNGPVTIDGTIFSLLGSVLYQGSHPVTTMTPKATSSSESARTTKMSSSRPTTTISNAPTSATSTGDASRPSTRSGLMFTSLMIIAAMMIRL